MDKGYVTITNCYLLLALFTLIQQTLNALYIDKVTLRGREIGYVHCVSSTKSRLNLVGE